ncbi:MAG: hypothetical protein IT305_20810 [Chloroflexi bacterium]|nr:hypothetical protein [Chloroflexota bacterium]
MDAPLRLERHERLLPGWDAWLTLQSYLMTAECLPLCALLSSGVRLEPERRTT